MQPLRGPIQYEPFEQAQVTATLSPESLGPDHLGALTQAISNVLLTELAEFTFAQLIDGLPTCESFDEFHRPWKTYDHPAFSHLTLCEGVIDKVYKFRSEFDPLSLRFEPEVLQAFQNAIPGNRAFHRLIELVVVACHQIVVLLFQTEGNNHKGEYDAWIAEEHRQKDAGVEKFRFIQIEPPVAFYHQAYRAYRQYPCGISDMVGYWAEAKIFGGVVLFDRSDSDVETKEVYFHESLHLGPTTIYPLLPDQFQNLITFLLSNTSDTACPIPMHATKLNRPRYSSYHAMKYFKIFRNRYERRLPLEYRTGCTSSSIDYPEIEDQFWILDHLSKVGMGKLTDKAEYEAVKERMKKVSPSSPLWSHDPDGPSYT